MADQHFFALLGFAFVAAWIGLGLGSALLCLVGAAIPYLVSRFMRGELDVEDLRERVEGARTGFSRSGSGTQAPSPTSRPRVR